MITPARVQYGAELVTGSWHSAILHQAIDRSPPVAIRRTQYGTRVSKTHALGLHHQRRIELTVMVFESPDTRARSSPPG
ncbi:hypothetical protein RRG08_019454 [Elysia crispata]|uniref:Uncharacterized protein n=1 Tax=Elysia crispata TaxID=231223 RepID=A0AAE1CVB3_9GAST|nr:hypothetical protein RRG08_019454 [Elysia crispata]